LGEKRAKLACVFAMLSLKTMWSPPGSDENMSDAGSTSKPCLRNSRSAMTLRCSRLMR